MDILYITFLFFFFVKKLEFLTLITTFITLDVLQGKKKTNKMENKLILIKIANNHKEINMLGNWTSHPITLCYPRANVLGHKPDANVTFFRIIRSEFRHLNGTILLLWQKKDNFAAWGTRATSQCLNSNTGASVWFLTFHFHLHQFPPINIF